MKNNLFVQKTEFIIEKEEGLQLLAMWEKFPISGCKLYGDINALSPFIKVGNQLKKIHTEGFAQIDAKDFYDFASLMICNVDSFQKKGEKVKE